MIKGANYMCGIIYAKNLINNHPVNNLVKILYQNQKDRGQQGFGFVGLNAENIDTYRATYEKGIIKDLNHYQYDEILFHHRLPTSTENTLKTTHPFVCDIDSKRYYFIHNGIIVNADKLKKKHSKKGIVYSSEKNANFNDSEALAWDFCLWLNQKQKEIEAKGSVAFICLETDKKTNQAEKLYFYRNDASPLQMYKDKTLFLIASEGSYADIKKNWLYLWDYQKRQVRKNKFLEIQSPELFSFYNYDYTCVDEIDDEEGEFDLTGIKVDIRTLEQERDYLLSIGKYVEAETIELEIDDLKDQLREARKLLSPLT
jgi:predicted glutamine amidotransferase